MMNLTVAELRMLAKLERDMDEGKQEYVISDSGGGRLAVSKSTMEKLMLKSGQRISDVLYTAILESHLEELNTLLKIPAHFPPAQDTPPDTP